MSTLSDIVDAVGGPAGLVSLAGGAVGLIEQLKQRGFTDDQIRAAQDYAKQQTDTLVATGGDVYTDTQNLANTDLEGSLSLADSLAARDRARLQGITGARFDAALADATQTNDQINRGEDEILTALAGDQGAAISRINQLLNPVAFAAGSDRTRAIDLGEESVARGREAVDQARDQLSPISRIASQSARSAPVTASELEGLLYSMALKGVGDTYDPITESVSRQALRSGADSTKQLEALTDKRRDDTLAAAIESRIRGLTGAADINNSRLSNAAQVAGGIQGTLVNSENVLKDIILGSQQQRQAATGQLANILGSQASLEDAVRGRTTQLGTGARQDASNARTQVGLTKMGVNADAFGDEIAGNSDISKNRTAITGQALGDLGATRRIAATNLNDALKAAYTNNAVTQAGIAGAGYANDRRKDTPIGSIISGGAGIIGKIIDKIF